MKKTLLIFVAVLMIFGMLAGCANTAAEPEASPSEAQQSSTQEAQPEPAGEVALSFFTGKVETIDIIDEIMANFNAEDNGITIEQEYQSDASNVIKIKFASDAVPDVMTTYEQEYASQGKFLDLSDQSQWWDRLIPSMKEYCTDISSGKQFRVCTNITVAGFFYNKEIFDELGLKPATTWTDFAANLQAIKDAHPDMDPWFIFGSEAWHLGHLIEFLPHGYIKAKYGTTEAKQAMLDNDKEKLNFGDPSGAMATFAKNLVDLQKSGLINEDVLTATSDNCVQAFVNGETAMFSNGMWALSGILEANPDMADKIGFAPYPSFMDDGVPMILVAEDSGYSIYADSANIEAAKTFLDYLFSAENQKLYSETLGSPSAFSDVEADWAPATVVDGVAQAVNGATNIGFTNEKPAGFSGDDAGRLVQDLLAGTYSPEEFAAAYEQAWDAGFTE
jgi:raffinose/stachyose/melibiose transport system substrate-binding protein